MLLFRLNLTLSSLLNLVIPKFLDLGLQYLLFIALKVSK